MTPDHVNPEAPWPQLDALRYATEAQGKTLAARLPVYPHFVRQRARWIDRALHAAVLRRADAEGLGREDHWTPGLPGALPELCVGKRASGFERARNASLTGVLARALDGRALNEGDIVALFRARGREFEYVCRAADELRAAVSGASVGYVVNRNINYTNVCYFKCGFCAFSKGKPAEQLREKPYDLDIAEIARRTREAWQRGATEVCLQGGIHPHYSGRTYLDICRAVKHAEPDIHVHAFSPLEVWHGARTLGMTLAEFLTALAEAGLGTLPGTAAEVLDDEVRAVICPDKINTAQWLEVMEAAHAAGLRSTATIMFGHVDEPQHWARHLLRVRALQARTGGFTEFVPLPFVAQQAPLYIKGAARRGPTLREAVLMHAVARLALHPYLTNIQTSWVKMGPDGAALSLQAGANDLGGTLMNESITRAAGASFGQEFPPQQMETLIRSVERRPRQRSTLYGDVPQERRRRSFEAGPLAAPAYPYACRRGGAAVSVPPLRFG